MFKNNSKIILYSMNNNLNEETIGDNKMDVQYESIF